VKLPLIVTDFLATGLIAIAAIVVIKTIVLSTPLAKIEGLHKVIASV
jgi:hypothetical protein